MKVLLSGFIVLSHCLIGPTCATWRLSDWHQATQQKILVKLVWCTLNWSEMDETKVIYHIDDEDTPYLVKLPKSPAEVTLSDFKNVLNRPSYKFFFKSMDDDFGWVVYQISALCVDSLLRHCLHCLFSLYSSFSSRNVPSFSRLCICLNSLWNTFV